VTSTAPEIIVVGRGLLGSAAARHLADTGASVTLIGPGEPADPASHSGVFGSHHDSGRIMRIIDRNPYLAQIAAASIERQQELEMRTGIRFSFPVGHITMTTMSGYYEDLVETGERFDVSFDQVDSDDIERAFPYLSFPSDVCGVFESTTGGHIDPRRLIRAQCAALEDVGGALIDATAIAVKERGGGVQVQTDLGSAIEADCVLVATGAFANHHDVLPRPVAFGVQEHTVLFAELDEVQAARLSDMPSIIFKQGDEFGESVYLLPPITYPDGRTLLKIGQSTGRIMADPLEQMVPWFQGNGDPAVGEWLDHELRALIPSIRLGQMSTASCVVTKSPTGRQFIDQFDGAPIYSLLADDGQVAKSADELGRIAAHRVLTGSIPPEYEDEDFSIRYSDV